MIESIFLENKIPINDPRNVPKMPMNDPVYMKIFKTKEFLNPISGNFSGKGWAIGEIPRKEFIYNYIKSVSNIKWIKTINIFTKLLTPNGKKEIDFEDIKLRKFVVPVFGKPEINISVN